MISPLESQSVAVRAKGEQSFDRMPPVGQLASHMKREIELGGRYLS